MRSYVPAFLRRPLLSIVAVLFFFLLLRVTAPDPARIDFGPAAEAPVHPSPASIPLADRLLPVHTLALWCAVTRRHSSAGANPARQLSLQPVAVGADDGGNDIG